jgi:hypothetical protein
VNARVAVPLIRNTIAPPATDNKTSQSPSNLVDHGSLMQW